MRYILIWLFLFSACAHIDKNDPLKNTKKLINEGHSSLYQNGAFQIPSTKIKLIPEGPGPIGLALELSGTSAKNSFLSALSEAKDSVKIVVNGSKKSYELAQDGWGVAREMSKKISTESRSSGIWIIENSSELSKKIYGKTFELSPSVKNAMLIYSKSLSEKGVAVGDNISVAIDKDSLDFKNKLIKKTEETSSKLTAEAQEIWNEGKNSFIHGYVVLPKRISENFDSTNQSITFKNFADQYEKSNNHRREWSQNMSFIISGTLQEYPTKNGDSFDKIKSEFVGNTNTVGLTFASFKAAGSVVDRIFWEGGLKPIGKLGMAGLGYVFINGLAYPAMITADAGIETGNVLVQITKGIGVSVVEVVAPTGRVAISAIMSGAAWSTGTTTNFLGHGSAYVARGASLATAPVLKYAIQGSSVGAAKTIEYVGVPLVQAGIYTGGALFGVVTHGGGMVAGKTVDWGGQALSGGTSAVGGAVATSTAFVGTVGSVGLGTLNGLYQIGKATAVPSAQILGGAVVLSYGTLTQLSAHTILVASDAAYFVLSMEGPSFVIYSIKGAVSSGEKLPTNAVLNLEELRKQGEVIKKIPVSDQEMQKVLRQVEKEYGE